MSSFSQQFKAAVAGFALLSLPACKEKESQAAMPEKQKQTVELQLPEAGLKAGNVKVFDVKDGDTLSNFIGSENASKIFQLNNPLPFGFVQRGQDVAIIDSAGNQLRAGDKVYIFPDVFESFKNFNSSIHGNSEMYSAKFYHLCEQRMAEILVANDKERGLQLQDLAKEFKSEFMPVSAKYKVKSGDTLSEISEQILKATGVKIGHQSTKISVINHITDIISVLNNDLQPRDLKVGQSIVIPVLRKPFDPEKFLTRASDDAISGLSQKN